MNPADALAEGLTDGDYVWVDADPQDRPYPGWEASDDSYDVARAMMRVRFQPSLPQGVTRSWMNVTNASHKSVAATESRDDGMAKAEDTNYVGMYRQGGHQSATTTWLRRTWLTDTMPRKNLAGLNLDDGFEPDVHAANGAPKEAFVKVEKAEDGGVDGEGDWRPVEEGVRPTNEDERMENYLAGGFVGRSESD
jgi:nitrate reductase alpha subunit